MAKITRAIFNKRRKTVRIDLDNHRRADVSLELATSLGVRPGMEVSEDEFSIIIKKSQAQSLVDKAYKYISYRPRSEQEVRLHLKKSGSLEEIEKTIAKLKKLGVINDLSFAEWWAEQRRLFRPKSRLVIAQELKQKGISKIIVDGIKSEMDERSTASQIAKKKLEKMNRLLSQEEKKKKIIPYLARRGFSWDVIREIIEKIDKKE